MPGGDYALSSYSGDIDVTCPGSSSFELNAKTSRGRVEKDESFPLTVNPHAVRALRTGAHSLVGTYNEGNATVQLSTFSGVIRIRRQQ